MNTYTPGSTVPLCLLDWRDNDNAVINQAAFNANGGAISIRILDSSYAAVTAASTATLTNLNDWCASLVMPATEGSYIVEVATTYDGLDETRYEDILVRRAGGVVLVVGGTTLLDLRRRLGYRLGDIIIATATSAGSTSQFYDERTLRLSDNAYRSWEAYVADAAYSGNVGESRTVQGSNQAAGAITVQPPLTAGIFSAGDVVELHNRNGIGWTVAEKHAAINEAISQAATMGGIEAVASTTGLFNRDDPLVSVPSQLRFVHAVEWLDTDGQGRSIPYARGRGKSGWWANRATGQIEVSGDHRERADGATIRFWGHGEHVPLTGDTDATLVNPTWIIAAATYYLALGYGQDRNPDKMRSLIADCRQEMAVWRRAATRVRPASSVAVRGY